MNFNRKFLFFSQSLSCICFVCCIATQMNAKRMNRLKNLREKNQNENKREHWDGEIPFIRGKKSSVGNIREKEEETIEKCCLSAWIWFLDSTWKAALMNATHWMNTYSCSAHFREKGTNMKRWGQVMKIYVHSLFSYSLSTGINFCSISFRHTFLLPFDVLLVFFVCLICAKKSPNEYIAEQQQPHNEMWCIKRKIHTNRYIFRTCLHACKTACMKIHALQWMEILL